MEKNSDTFETRDNVAESNLDERFIWVEFDGEQGAVYQPMIRMLRNKGYALERIYISSELGEEEIDPDCGETIIVVFEKGEELPSAPYGFDIVGIDYEHGDCLSFVAKAEACAIARQAQLLDAMLQLNYWIQELPDRRLSNHDAA